MARTKTLSNFILRIFYSSQIQRERRSGPESGKCLIQEVGMQSLLWIWIISKNIVSKTSQWKIHVSKYSRYAECIYVDMWGFISMHQHLTKSQKTERPNLWTCCQLLEAPWDFSLGSPSSVEWRLSNWNKNVFKKYILLFKLGKTHQKNEKGEIFHS